MSDTLVLAFGRGRYAFKLPMPRVIEIERLCGDKSIVQMYEELSAGIGIGRDDDQPRFIGVGTPRLKDIYEVIRCAAIGGGEATIAGETTKVSAIDAATLVDEYVADGAPGRFAEAAPVAWAILDNAIMGARLKKKAGDQPQHTGHTVEVK
jgi:hypothetical protein